MPSVAPSQLPRRRLEANAVLVDGRSSPEPATRHLSQHKRGSLGQEVCLRDGFCAVLVRESRDELVCGHDWGCLRPTGHSVRYAGARPSATGPLARAAPLEVHRVRGFDHPQAPRHQHRSSRPGRAHRLGLPAHTQAEAASGHDRAFRHQTEPGPQRLSGRTSSHPTTHPARTYPLS